MSVKFNLSKRRKLNPTPPDCVPEDASPEAADSRSQAEKDQDADKLQQEGNNLAEQAKFSLAIKRWDQALLLKPDSAALYELKAQAFMALDEHWPAVQSGSRAVSLDPDWPDGHLTLARAQRNYGEPEMALVSLRKVLRLEPDHQEALAELDEVQQLAIEERKREHEQDQSQQQQQQQQQQGEG